MQIIRGNRDQDRLFTRMMQAVRSQPLNGTYDCAIHGFGAHLLVVLSDSVSGEPVWHSSGEADAILRDFEKWLGRQKPN
jgi:hypothetical protein